MKILLVACSVSTRPWGDGLVAAELARSLASRGHVVHTIAEAVEDESMFPAGAAGSCEARTNFRDNAPRAGNALRRFAAARARRTPHDVALSLTRLVPASVWMPIDFGPIAWAGHVRRNAGAMRLLMKIPRHWRFPEALLAEGRAPRMYAPTGAVQRLLVFGRRAADDAARLLPRLSGRIVNVGVVSRMDPPEPGELLELRNALRSALGLRPDRPVVLVSVPWSISVDDPELAAFFGGAALLGSRSPVLLVLARDAMTIHRAAIRPDGMADQTVRILGRTARIDAALAAADAVALPLTPAAGPFRSGSMGRLVADALRFGRPVLAAAGVSGAEVISTASTTDHPGLVVAPASAEAWASALQRTADRAWLDSASVAAARSGKDLTFSALVDHVERVLGYVVSPGAASGVVQQSPGP